MSGVGAFWARFQSAHPGSAALPATTCFGDTATQQDELCDLVLAGRKRATASLAIWYGGAVPLPAAGDLAIVLDGGGAPRCVIRTVDVHVGPFDTADAAFAAAEGEGDGSLAYWIAEHRRFFGAELARQGQTFSGTHDVVFERFGLVWQPDGSSSRPSPA